MKYIFTRILKVLTPQNASYARLLAYSTEETNASPKLYTPSNLETERVLGRCFSLVIDLKNQIWDNLTGLRQVRSAPSSLWHELLGIP